jgi:hypothetical protein
MESVADQHDPGLDRDRGPCRAVRIAEPVPALVTGAHDRAHVGEPVDRSEDLLTERRVLPDDLELVVRQRARLLQDLGGDPDLPDVVEERSELEPLQRLAVEPQLAADEQRHVGDPARVRRRVLVARLQCVRQGLDRRDERALEALIVLGALDRELGLLREPGEQGELPVVELTVADRGRERPHSVPLQPERSDDDAAHVPLSRPRQHGEVGGLQDERLASLQPLVRERARNPAFACGVELARVAERGPCDQIVRLAVLGDPQRRPARSEHPRGHLRASSEDLVRGLGGRDLAAGVQQGGRDLGRLTLLAVEACLLKSDGGLIGERCEQALAILVELTGTDDDAPVDAVALGERRGRTLVELLADTCHALVGEPQRRLPRPEQRGALVDRQRADLVEGLRVGEAAGEGEQRLRAFGLPALLLVETRVFERDRRLAGEHLEQPDIVLVELIGAELRDDDRAGDARAVAQRHDDQRLLQLVRAGNPRREPALERVRHEQRLPRRGHATRDAPHLQVGDRADVARGRRGPGGRPLGRALVVEHHLVLSVRLRRHHRRLRARDQLARVHRVQRPLRDTGRDGHPPGRLEVGLTQPLGEAGGQPQRVPGVARRHDHPELLAADSTDDVGAPDGLPRDARELDQELVAGRMAVDVVDALEVVEIEHQDGDRVARARGARQLRAQALVEEAVVVEAGQRVGLRQMLQPCADLRVVQGQCSRVAEPFRELEFVLGERRVLAQAVDVEGALQGAAGDQRHDDDRLWLVRRAGDDGDARIQVGAVRPHRAAVRDGPAGQSLAEARRELANTGTSSLRASSAS